MRPPRRADPDHGLRKKCHERIPRCHWQAIELGVVGRGVPDSNGCADGTEFWVEHKWTDTWAVGLEPEQVGWILRRMRAGGRVFIFVWRETQGGPRLGPPVSELHIFEGWDAAELKASGMAEVPAVAVYEGGPSLWDWGHIRGVLTEWPIGRR